MITSFNDDNAEAIFNRRKPGKGFPSDIVRTARRKLVMLNNARELKDLRKPPGNRLEALERKRAGQHSIRINEQWRVCFVWTGGNAEHVEIVDYHDEE